MRNLKAIVILAFFVVLLVAANFAVRYGVNEVKASGRRALIEDTEGLCKVRLERKGCQDVVLGLSGTNWRLLAPYSGSVDEQIVMRLLDTLSTTQITDMLYDSALLKLGKSRADFDLVDPSLKIVLTFGNGVSESLGFGSQTPLPGGVYVSISGLDSVFVVPSSVLEIVNVGAERFRRRSVFRIGPDAVASFGIRRRAEAPLEFSRGDGGWRIRNTAVSTLKVTEFLSSLTAAEATSFVWPIGGSNETEHVSSALLAGYGLDPDSAVTVLLKGLDGKDRRITFGKESSAGCVYALIHGGTTIVTVPSSLKELAEQEEGVFTDSRIFPFEARAVSSFSVSDGDVQYALVREKDGGWMIDTPIAARADTAVADEMLARILSLSASDLVPSGEGVMVSIATNTEKSAVSRTSVFGSLTPERLRSREIVRIDPARVKRIVRTGEGGKNSVSVVFDRERKAWNVENGTSDVVVDPRGVETVLAAINPLVAVSIAKLKVPAADLDDYGLDTPSLTVAIDQDADGAVRRNIMIGKRTHRGCFATIGSSDAVFIVSEGQVKSLSAPIVGR